ncbi:MAG TPA: GMC family oxidoreductase [Acetobacteraceae bacterium]|jgi:choline dehydrogenase-like flavoprotein|nr:GMC family oxidoreductase [Acetobacteraceae bacterium]
MPASLEECDYVIVGSGAGGGTLAARLAEAGMHVVVLEAGGDPRDGPGLPEDYDVPAFHPLASENPAMSWDFFVQHYADEARRRRDWKLQPDGIFYPRAGTLGGCTAHNAMILMPPHDEDWDGIAALTGDASWQAKRMRRYFRKLEKCRYRPVWRVLSWLGLDRTGHGWNGWLPTECAMPWQVFEDRRLLETLADSAHTVLRGTPRLPRALRRLLRFRLDPNDQRLLHRNGDGLCFTPLSTDGHRRTGTRERLLDVASCHRDCLRIELNALATRVLFDADNRAIGVEYQKGERLYRAHPRHADAPGEVRTIHARREVVLAGGAFNTPQLLMLSGIGPSATLDRHGIDVRVDLPGVGRNLQDRYEVGVVNRMAKPWRVLEGADFTRGDRLFGEWSQYRTGMYVSNGAALAVSLRSQPDRPVPDLFCMALLARFRGYVPGYSRDTLGHHDYFTWAVLKAHTNNRAGEVTLRSNDPRDMPLVDFHYFEEGSDPAGEDLKSVVTALRFVRKMTATLKQCGMIEAEESPGEDVQEDAQFADYVRNNAWGHHASCTCAIGPREANGVLDSRLRVHGTERLRVVDASVFPRIPGFFIAGAIYMVGEKAADMILEDA